MLWFNSHVRILFIRQSALVEYIPAKNMYVPSPSHHKITCQTLIYWLHSGYPQKHLKVSDFLILWRYWLMFPWPVRYCIAVVFRVKGLFPYVLLMSGIKRLVAAPLTILDHLEFHERTSSCLTLPLK